MLRSLNIRDFVIVDELDLDLDHGFTVLTGETGAGKSILLDALSLVLGERADPSQIREGKSKAEISALFSLDGSLKELISNWLDEQGFNLEDDVKNNPLLRGKVADELSTNRGLREVLYALPSVMPVPNYSVTSDFGVRRHPLSGKTHFHTGVDMLSQTGDEKVHPVKPGVVVLAQFHPQYGNTVVVRHTNGVESLYAHLANIEVKLGDKVTNESVLGNIGSTGSSSTGKHLHLEILIGGYPVNPQKVIRTAQYVQQIQNQQR